jgi:O-antigen/teichoic acid export membrane protein
LQFSRWLLLLNMLAFLRDRSSDFIIGRLGGAGALGLFSVSYELASMPGAELVAPINRAVYPAYAKLAHDPEAMRREYLSVMSMICLVAIPAVSGIAATAELIVPLVLGEKWLAATPILQVLAIFGISQVMLSNAYASFLALGRGDIFARLNGLSVALLIVLLLVLVPRYGVVGGAYAYLLSALSTLPLSIFVILRTLKLGVLRFLNHVWRALFAAAAMYASVHTYVASRAATNSTPLLAIEMLTAIVLGAVSYIGTVALFWVLVGRPLGAETVIWNRVIGMTGKLRQKLRSG